MRDWCKRLRVFLERRFATQVIREAPVAQTIGIELPGEFPTAAYNAVSAKLGAFQSRRPTLWTEYAGGWNAIAIRFRSAIRADDVFTASIKVSTSPSPEERQIQEEALFTFFVTGYAAIESFAYALFALGAMLRPADFPLSTQGHYRAITPVFTKDKFVAHFGGTSAELALSALIADPMYEQWGRIRNVLAHRSAPPRQHALAVGVGGGSTGATMGPTEWQIIGGLVLNDRTTRDKREWLATRLTESVQATDSFVSKFFESTRFQDT